MLFLMWLQATVPGIVFAWLLFGPSVRWFRSRARPVEA
jgi:hypothetical protein